MVDKSKVELLNELDLVVEKARLMLNEQGLQIESGYGEVKNLLVGVSPYEITDLTYLKSNGGVEKIAELCQAAKECKAKTVCVNSINIETALSALGGDSVGVITVEGFPLGATEINNLIQAVKNDFVRGACEVDVVFPHAFMSDKNYAAALYYLTQLRHSVTGCLKVILETSEYSKEEIAVMSLICKEAGMDFVKTSTGFSSAGATTFDIALMRRCVGNHIGVKASGGVKTIGDALKMMEYGATRIGASSLKPMNVSDY